MQLTASTAGQTPSLARAQEENVPQRYSLVMQALCATFGERLKAAVLFGSHARGEARLDSDHDLFVVIDDLPIDPVARQRAVRAALLPILDKLPGAMSLVAKTPQEVAANLTPLLLDICVDGICLYGASYFEPYRARGLAALRQSKLRRKRVGGALMWSAPSISTNWELSWEGYFERAQ